MLQWCLFLRFNTVSLDGKPCISFNISSNEQAHVNIKNIIKNMVFGEQIPIKGIVTKPDNVAKA